MINQNLASGSPIPFGEKLAASAAFDSLFRDGMSLVEETAAYLDGTGRETSRRLPRLAALAYASESMRLTTRLMQVASWLLLQRAINEGEMSPSDAANDKRRSRTAWQAAPLRGPDETALPVQLLALVERSLRLQERIQRLDTIIREPVEAEPQIQGANPIAAQFALLRDAFPG